MQVQQPQLSTSKELQCSTCFLMFPMQHIQEQADNSSPWVVESEQSPDLSECEISVEMEESPKQLPQLNMSQYKSLLKDEIARCPTRLSTNKKRINVRKGFFWENFKAGRISKIRPHCFHSCALWSMVYTRVLYCTETSGGIWRLVVSTNFLSNHSCCCALFSALAITQIRSYCRRAAIRWGRTLVTL